MNGFTNVGTRSFRSGMLLGTLVLAACGGGHGASAVPPSLAASASPAAASTPGLVFPTSARLTINIPKAGVGTNAADKRRPQYVSPGTLSMRVVAAPSGTLSQLPPSYLTTAYLAGAFDLSPTSTLCTNSPATSNYSRSCVLSVTVPPALAGAGAVDLGIETYNVAVSTFSGGSVYAEPGGTTPLSEGIVTAAAITQFAANTVNVVLGGVPQSSQPPGSLSTITLNATNHLREGVGTILPIVAYDASGNVIVGPYFNAQTVTVNSNTPDISFNVNGVPAGASATVYGSSDVLDLVYTGKGMLTGAVSAFNQYSTIVINDINTIDEYDSYDDSGSAASQMPFSNFQPTALATNQQNTSDTDIFVLSNSGPNGQPVLADIQFGNSSTLLNNAYASCNLGITLPSNTSIGPMMVVDNTNAYVYASAGGVVTEVTIALSSLASASNGVPANTACQYGTAGYYNSALPVVGAAYGSDGAIWSIDANGYIARLVPSGSGAVATFTQFSNGTSSIPTNTVGGPLYSVNTPNSFTSGGTAQLPFSGGLVWADTSYQDETLNVLDISDGGNGSYTTAIETPGCGVLSNYYYASGSSGFVDAGGNVDVGFADGSIFSVNYSGAPCNGYNQGDAHARAARAALRSAAAYTAARKPAASRRTQGSPGYTNFSLASELFYPDSAFVGPTIFVDGLENGNALYGIYGAGSAASNRGLVRYSRANGNTTPAVLPYFPNSSDANYYSPASAVMGGDGRLYFLSANPTNGGPYEMYAFPGRGNGNIAQSKKRAPAVRK